MFGNAKKFNNAKEMYACLMNGFDLYSPKEELYVFCYNEDGSLCSYDITPEEAEELNDKCGDEYWGAQLGFGGYIYDGNKANEFCEDTWVIEDWEVLS